MSSEQIFHGTVKNISEVQPKPWKKPKIPINEMIPGWEQSWVGVQT